MTRHSYSLLPLASLEGVLLRPPAATSFRLPEERPADANQVVCEIVTAPLPPEARAGILRHFPRL